MGVGVIVFVCFIVIVDEVFGLFFGVVLVVLVTALVLYMKLGVLELDPVLVRVLDSDLVVLLAPVLVVSTWLPINAESMPLESKLPRPEDLIGSWAIDISCGKLMMPPLPRPITLDIDWNVSSLY